MEEEILYVTQDLPEDLPEEGKIIDIDELDDLFYYLKFVDPTSSPEERKKLLDNAIYYVYGTRVGENKYKMTRVFKRIFPKKCFMIFFAFNFDDGNRKGDIRRFSTKVNIDIDYIKRMDEDQLDFIRNEFDKKCVKFCYSTDYILDPNYDGNFEACRDMYVPYGIQFSFVNSYVYDYSEESYEKVREVYKKLYGKDIDENKKKEIIIQSEDEFNNWSIDFDVERGEIGKEYQGEKKLYVSHKKYFHEKDFSEITKENFEMYTGKENGFEEFYKVKFEEDLKTHKYHYSVEKRENVYVITPKN